MTKKLVLTNLILLQYKAKGLTNLILLQYKAKGYSTNKPGRYKKFTLLIINKDNDPNDFKFLSKP